ncbi:MAG TPA: recombinase family protein [Candidatus Sphingobacterium stercorigallinarum]|nr:recombinase family protein [Candidatus Sphingobacterium stercorigallinarum]
MGLAPVGYVNKTEENGKKYIAPKEPDASILRWSFEEIAKGDFNTEQIWKQARLKGLKCSKNAFWQVIRNPLYCGKIFLPQYKDGESRFVQGQHEAIISESLYYEVQDVLDGRGRNYRPKIKTLDEFPMRGFLICPNCEKLLTGSKSKGRNRYYAYYHCVGGCKHRVNAEKVNDVIKEDLLQFIPKIENKEFYQEAICKAYLEQTNQMQLEQKEILIQIKDFEDRLSHMRDLLATRQIDAEDYREIKSQYNMKIAAFESQLTTLNNDVGNIQSLIEQGISKIMEINHNLENGNIMEIRNEIGSIYPEKMQFKNNGVRTARRNDFIRYINLINKKLGYKKNGTKVNLSTLSRQVGVAGLL